MYVFALCQKMRVPDTTRGFGRVLFDCLRKFKKKKKKNKKKKKKKTKKITGIRLRWGPGIAK